MLRQDTDGHVVRECHVHLIQLDLNSGLIRALDVLDVGIVGNDLRRVFLIQDGFQRELDILRGQRFSVVECQTFAQMEGVGQGVFIKIPVLRQSRNQFIP